MIPLIPVPVPRKRIISDAYRDLTGSPVSDVAFRTVATGLPLEISLILWKQVFMDNLEIEEVLSICSENAIMGQIAVEILRKSSCSLIPSGNGKVYAEFYGPIFGNIDPTSLVGFLKRHKIKVLICNVSYVSDSYDSMKDFLELCENIYLRQQHYNFAGNMSQGPDIVHILINNKEFLSNVIRLPNLNKLFLSTYRAQPLLSALSSLQKLVHLKRVHLELHGVDLATLLPEQIASIKFILRSGVDLTLCFKFSFSVNLSNHIKWASCNCVKDVKNCISDMKLRFLYTPTIPSDWLLKFERLKELLLEFVPFSNDNHSISSIALANRTLESLAVSYSNSNISFDFSQLSNLKRFSALNSKFTSSSFNTLPSTVQSIKLDFSYVIDDCPINCPASLSHMSLTLFPTGMFHDPIFANLHLLKQLSSIEVDVVDVDYSNKSPEYCFSFPDKFFQFPPNVSELTIHLGSSSNSSPKSAVNFKSLLYVKSLILEGSYCKCFDLDLLPPNLITLILKIDGLQEVNNQFPITLKSLRTSLPIRVVNESLKSINLKYLRLVNSYFNYDISGLNCSGLTYLTIELTSPNETTLIVSNNALSTLAQFNVYVPYGAVSIENADDITQ